MTGDSAEQTPKRGNLEQLEMDFRTAQFPSDALSVARLRKIFPKNFDSPGRIPDGFANNDFFFPMGPENPEHLVRLNEMICDERVIAAGAYYRQFLDKHPDIYVAEDIEEVEHSSGRLTDAYQFFKLADSPETARLLIQQVEQQGAKQALQHRSKGR